MSLSQSRCNHNNNDNKAQSLGNSRRETTEYIAQSTSASDQMMKNMRKELDEVKNAMKGNTAVKLDDMIKIIDSPFTIGVLNCPLPPKFRLPQPEVYDGTKDALDHIGAFKTILSLQQTPDKVICRTFLATLNKLLAVSIANFDQLSDSFVRHFIRS